MNKIIVILILSSSILALAWSDQVQQESYAPFKEKLSDYGFFEGELAALKPIESVVEYTLNTPLFSDYAHKNRFIQLPKGAQANYHSTEVLDFPVGTTLIKNFYYYNDERKSAKGRQIIETRLLVHQEKGWEAVTYVWNEEQTEAYLDLAGDSRMIKWIDAKGKKQKVNYQIPNKNQCKGCHNRSKKIQPIGPSARQLNHSLILKEGEQNQLVNWSQKGMLKGLPSLEKVPKIATWDNPKTGTLEERARAWLDINCAHCHRTDGPANTSGLFLTIHETNPTALGIYKTPIAAGRGSGGFRYDIEPGNAKKSILVYRMESMDPGVMMPEIARSLVHKEGLALVKEWINNLNAEEYKK